MDDLTLDDARRLLARARAVLGTVVNAEPDEPLPRLAMGVASRLHGDIANALARHEAAQS